MTIMGIGKHVSGVINTSTFVTFGVGNDVIFRDLFIENKSQRRYAIHSRDVNAPHLSNCKINGMIYLYNETPKPLKGITMEYCDVISDFENDWNGHNDQKDAISLYGYLGSKFINNTFDTKNLNRLFKFSIGNVTQSNPYWITSENNARDIIIIGNTFKGSGGKQVIDMFNLTSGLRFVNNHLEMVDVPDSPYGWGYLINYKSPNDLRDNKDIGSAIVLDGNTGIYPGDLLKLSGCYGVNYPNYNGTNYHTVKVTNNHIKRTRMNAPHGWMHIAFYNDVILSGNTFEIPALPHACILRVSSNENVIVDNTNTFIGGNIIVDKATKDESQEIEFTGKGGDVFIAAKVHKFNTRGAVILSGDFDYQNITVDGLRSYPNVDATEYALPVYCYNVNSGMARDILVKNCDATKNGNRNVQPYYATVLKNVIREENNSWNTRMVSTDFNPGEIEVGASKSTIVNYPDVAVGDFVQATFSQYHADLEVRAVVSEANKVTVFLKNTGESQIILTSGYLIIRKI